MDYETLEDVSKSLSLAQEVAGRNFQKLLSNLRQRQNSMTPIIKKLPAELFDDILCQAMDGYPFRWELSEVQDLRLVSTYFNQRVCSNPRLWAILDSTFANTPEKIQSIIQMSKNAPLSIYIAPPSKYDAPGSRDQIMQAAWPYASRWKHLHIAGPLTRDVSMLLTVPTPLMETVILGEVTKYTEADFPEVLFAGEAPGLRMVQMGISMLTETPAKTLENVVDLRLHGLHELNQLRDILDASCRSLTDLHLSFAPNVDTTARIQNSRTTLLHLQVLRIKGSFQDMSSILQTLDLPRCRFYHLEGQDSAIPTSEIVSQTFDDLSSASPSLSRSSFVAKLEDTAMDISAYGPGDDSKETTTRIVIQSEYMHKIAGTYLTSKIWRNTVTLGIEFEKTSPREGALARLSTPNSREGWRFPNLTELYVLGYEEKSLQALVARRHGSRPDEVGGQHPPPVRLEQLYIMSAKGEKNPPDFLPEIEAGVALPSLTPGVDGNCHLS